MTLKELRHKRKIKSIEIARKLGISQGHYSNLERGTRAFNDEQIQKLANILNVSVKEVRTAVNNTRSSSYKLGSWLSNIRLNGLPFMKAFQYYAKLNNLDRAIKDDEVLKLKVKEFIEQNIGFSIIAELSENSSLLNQIKEKIGLSIK